MLSEDPNPAQRTNPPCESEVPPAGRARLFPRAYSPPRLGTESNRRPCATREIWENNLGTPFLETPFRGQSRAAAGRFRPRYSLETEFRTVGSQTEFGHQGNAPHS